MFNSYKTALCCLALSAPFAVCGDDGRSFVSAPEAPFPMPAIPVWTSGGRDFPLNDFGGDFNKAIEAAAAAGGGRVVVPPGEWPTGAIRLKSDVELHLDKDAKVVFSDDPKDYLPAVHTSWEGVELVNYSPLVYAYGCTNVAITGGGTFAPKMGLWRKWFARPPEHMAFTAALYDWCSRVAPLSERDATKMPGSNARPHLLQFNRCRNVNLDGFRIRESPFWTIHLYHSENAVLRNLDVRAHGHNNDGVDVEMTRNVIVEKCRFDQGDDAVVIKAGRNQDAWALGRPSENIVVRDCTVADGHVLLGVGSELSGGVRNVFMHDCRMSGDVRGVFFVKTNERRGGFVENIYMKDCSVEVTGGHTPASAVGVETDVLYQWRKFPTHEVRVTRIRNIVAENVYAGRVRHILGVWGDERDPVDGVTLRNVTCGSVLEEPVVVVNAKNVTVDGKAVQSTGPSHTTLIAHRGESEDAPENTMAAYKLAVDRGFGFECDVYLSKDGRVFTFHDGTLTRTTAGANTNKCGDVTWEEISALDVGGWGKWKGSAFAGARPALLEEVLGLARNGRRIYIEVKTGPEIVPHIKKVFAAQTRAWPGNVLFISFNRESCKALKREMPEYKVFLLMGARKRGSAGCVTSEEALAALRETGADGLDFQYDRTVATAEFAKAVRDAGFEFHVWTIDRLDTAVEAFGRGAMTVTTNRAGKLLEEIGR